MKPKLADLTSLESPVDRGTYLFWGVALFALKHNLDRLIAVEYSRPWGPFNYVFPRSPGPGGGPEDYAFYAWMVAAALPFIAVGVTMTLRRLRDAGLPPQLVVLFFVPFLNLLFFLVLAMVPTAPAPGETRPPRFLDRFVPDSGWGAAAMGFVLAVPLGLALTVLSVYAFNDYGVSLFAVVPFSLGLAATLIYGYHRPRTLPYCLAVACTAVALLGGLIFVTAIEGAVCLAMAAPIGLALGAMGGFVGWVIQAQVSRGGDTQALLAALVVAMPVLMGAEARLRPEPPLLEVVTTREVDAPPAVVWRHVVDFSDLPPPTDWVFATGIAYPLRAELRGRGVGAIRHCVFSTGAFVEPITVWDEPRELAFGVESSPPPMEEWSPYGVINAPHLRGFMESQRGRFRLEPLPGGRTRLEGTTWYVHRIWPAGYWRIFGDWIIHRIHSRVLDHVAQLSEAPGAS